MTSENEQQKNNEQEIDNNPTDKYIIQKDLIDKILNSNDADMIRVFLNENTNEIFNIDEELDSEQEYENSMHGVIYIGSYNFNVIEGVVKDAMDTADLSEHMGELVDATLRDDAYHANDEPNYALNALIERYEIPDDYR